MKKIFVCAMLGLACYLQAAPILTENDRVAFYGDALVYYAHNSGYLFVRQLLQAMKTSDVNFTEKNLILRGAFDKTAEMLLETLDEKVLSEKPTWVFYMGCYYDVGYGMEPKPDQKNPKHMDDYRKTLATTFEKIKAAGAKCAVMSIMMQGEDVNSKSNLAADKVNLVLKEEAEKAGFGFIDMNAEQKKLKQTQGPDGLPVTAWGVLTTPISDLAMSEAVMRYCGISEAIIRNQTDTIRNRVEGKRLYNAELSFSIREWEVICKKAEAAGLKPNDYLQKLTDEIVSEL